MMCGTIFDEGLYLNASLDGGSRDLDERIEFDEIIDSREILAIYSNSLTYL